MSATINTAALVKSINEAHWAEDYSDAALPDDRFLRRRLGRRKTVRQLMN
jgi:hypothetical protein